MSGNNLRDGILYHRIKRKDKDAFIKSYDLYFDEIYRFAYFRLSNDKELAEDIASHTFLKAWNHIQNNNISDYKTLKSLFYRVARNLIIDFYRVNNKNKENISIDESDENNQNFELTDEKENLQKRIEIKDDFENICQSMNKLKSDYKEILTLRYINELSISEIAELLQKSKGNIRVLIFRAIKALKNIVQKEQ